MTCTLWQSTTQQNRANQHGTTQQHSASEDKTQHSADQHSTQRQHKSTQHSENQLNTTPCVGDLTTSQAFFVDDVIVVNRIYDKERGMRYMTHKEHP